MRHPAKCLFFILCNTCVLLVLSLYLSACCNIATNELCQAVKSRDESKILEILSEGVSPNIVCDNGQTPLSLASAIGEVSIAKLLLIQGADIESHGSDPEKRRPIHWASLNGHAGIVELLVDKGARVSVVDSSGRTPMDYAENLGHDDIEYILKQGAKGGASLSTGGRKRGGRKGARNRIPFAAAVEKKTDCSYNPNF